MNTPQPVMVERKARIFRFGQYPAKRWGITRAEFIAANGETGTIPIGLDPIGKGHYVGKSSVFDDQTGTADWWIEGDEVLGKLKMPDWVNQAATKHGLKLSGEFTPIEKALFQVNLVEKPHLSDAVLFVHEEGNVVVFEDDEPEPAVTFCDDDIRSFAQEIHELAASLHPGLCDPEIDDWEQTQEGRLVRLIHDHAVTEGGAYCPGMETEHDDPEEVTMSDENDRDETEETTPEAVSFEDSPVFKAMQAQLDRMASQLVEKDAVTFADSVTKGADARAYPAERAHIIGQYKRLAADDAKLPEAVTFSDGKTNVQGSRVDAFKASFSARPRVAVRDPKAVTFELAEEPPTGMTDESEKAARENRKQETQAWAKGHNANVAVN